jgi:hypothetical protein
VKWLGGVVVVVACSSAPPAKAPGAQPVPICSGQLASSQAAATTPRSGTMSMQLAPSFLDRMPACSKADTAFSAVADAGAVNAKGDCEWPSGVKCHFHLGTEFVVSGAPRPSGGELHCIVASSDPKSPRVFGTHFTCKAGTAVTHEHEPHAGAACGAGLLTALATHLDSCDARCCDDGTLTTTTAVREQAGTLDVRPDFRMCANTTELDCTTLAVMVGHSAYAPVFGAPIENGI